MLRLFEAERDREQFHSPKNLASAPGVESGELLEHFQWLSQAQSTKLSDVIRDCVGDELADVMIYAIKPADKPQIDLVRSIHSKITRVVHKNIRSQRARASPQHT